MNSLNSDTFGANPTNIKWTVVRGDTATLRIEFWDDTETNKQDISTWTFRSSAYDPKDGAYDTLTVTAGTGYVDITAPATLTRTWGNSTKAISAELSFDLQVTIGTKIWTPIIGTIVVLADVSLNPAP
jgi:hypothetical protein